MRAVHFPAKHFFVFFFFFVLQINHHDTIPFIAFAFHMGTFYPPTPIYSPFTAIKSLPAVS